MHNTLKSVSVCVLWYEKPRLKGCSMHDLGRIYINKPTQYMVIMRIIVIIVIIK